MEGCAHSIFEIVSNSIDEARDGHGDTINVTRCKDGSVIVEDFGRGMPVDWNNGEGRYNWELLFCEMYAGGKYGEGEDNYEFSLGLNGLGLCATSMLPPDDGGYLPDGCHYHLDFKRARMWAACRKNPTRAAAPAASSTGSRTTRSLPTSTCLAATIRMCWAAGGGQRGLTLNFTDEKERPATGKAWKRLVLRPRHRGLCGRSSREDSLTPCTAAKRGLRPGS
ncbi:MAG: hypothetical protein ACLT99_06140 [Faecalibacterium prausnitzii]